jgi:UDP-N-acetylglucosamine 4,6-dehydratase
MFKHKNILITGGAGTLGYELTKQLLAYDPNKIIIYSRDDMKHARMQKHFNDDRLRFRIGDVRDFQRLKFAMDDADYVIHAAALKNVDRGEKDPLEYKKVIVDGAQNIIQACVDTGVTKCVALSTDKASNPANVYGTCKLLSDKLFLRSTENYIHCKFSVIRYGNVMGSNGSAVQLLRNQSSFEIFNKEMTRFWITINYAAALVLHLLRYSSGDELLIPKLPSKNVLDVFKLMNPKAAITETELRVGEKIHESMITEHESDKTYEFENFYLIGNSKFNGYQGELVDRNFTYTSDNNPWIATDDEILMMLDGQWIKTIN